MADPKRIERGPFRADQLRSGDRYELSGGHAIYVAPTAGRGAKGAITGGEVLETDPAVTEAGLDAGYSPEPGTLRAPDVAVGNVPDAPGWIRGVPLLAVEYADTGQDEDELQQKIADLLRAGTRWVWVVRLIGPRRVEVYSVDAPTRTFGPDETIEAPGVLKNPVVAKALWDRALAHEVVLRNLLQRKGYESLEALREQGRSEGLEQGRSEGLEQGAQRLRAAVRALCEVLGIALDEQRQRRLDTSSVGEIEALIAGIKAERHWPE